MKEEKKTTKKTTSKVSGTSKKSPNVSKKKTTNSKVNSSKNNVKKKPVTQKKVIESVEPEKIQEKTINVSEPVVKKEDKVVKNESKLNTDKQLVMGTIIIILLAILAVVSMISAFYRAKENSYSINWENKSYLVEHEIASTDCEHVSNAILGDYSFVFVRDAVSNEEEFNLEKKLKKIIEDYRLKDHFYVYTLDNTCGVISDPYSVVGQNLSLTEGITKVPTILYYKDGKLVDYVKREDEQMMSDADFVHLLDIYEFEK